MQLNHSVAPRLKRNGSTDAQRAVIRNGLGIGLATGAYGLSFGALAISDGLSIAQACVLSLLMFTGGSQFAFVGVVGAGGSPLAAAAAAALLGSRNALYGLHLARLLRLRGVKKFATAQLVIDESSAMAMGSTSGPLARAGFWSCRPWSVRLLEHRHSAWGAGRPLPLRSRGLRPRCRRPGCVSRAHSTTAALRGRLDGRATRRRCRARFRVRAAHWDTDAGRRRRRPRTGPVDAPSRDPAPTPEDRL